MEKPPQICCGGLGEIGERLRDVHQSQSDGFYNQFNP